jgi:subtilase family serine protease
MRAVGTLEIRVSLDQDRSGLGVLFESSAAGLAADAESNNSASVQLLSASSTYADLQVESFTAPATGISGEQISIDWRVANRGSTATDSDWNDQLIISRDTVIGNGDDILVGNFRHSGGLQSGESYARSATLSLPFIAQGSVFLALRTDADQETIEPDTRADNSASAAFHLQLPAADLSVVQVTAPEFAVSGGSADIRWSVRNEGKAYSDLALWHDRLLLSSDATVDSGDIVVANVPHAGTLAPGESYLGEFTVTLPGVLSGSYFVLVDSDAGRRVAENGHTANNRAASTTPLRIEQTPVGDLAVSEVVGPTILRPGESASVSYRTRNVGSAAIGTDGHANPGNPVNTPWRDRIYLDQGAAGLREVASLLNSEPLAAGAAVSRSVSFTLPTTTAEGEFRWLVVADSDDSIDELTLDNNRATSAAAVRIVRSDLAITQVDYPGQLQSGATLHLEWQVENLGAATLGTWTDRVTVTRDGVSLLFAERSHSGPVDAGASYLGKADLLVPADFIGDYELVIVSDADAQLAERTRSNNRFAAPLRVQLAPYVDLVVDELTLSPEGALQPGETVTAHWLTSNQGNRSTEQPWNERLQLLNADSQAVLASVDLASDGPLAAGASRSRSAQFTWPSGAAAAGRFALRVIVDAGAQLAEANPAGNAETNNQAELLRVTGPDLLPGNLGVEAADASGIHAGAALTLAWEVRNAGASATDAVFKEHIRVRNVDADVVILETHLAFDPQATVDGQPAGPLLPGQQRQRHFDFTLPEGRKGSGRIEITLISDQSQNGVGAVFEHNLEGDAESNNSASIAFDSASRDYPDLRLETANAPPSIVGGEFAEVSWSVANRGAVDAEGGWNDQIILSSDDIIGNGDDLMIGSFRHEGGLDAGESYTQNVSLRMPLRSAGPYTLGIRTDSASEAEPDPGADNLGSALPFELITPIVDLSVIAVEAPAMARSGEEVSISWQVLNLGNATTNRTQWNDRILLSADTRVSSDDLVVAGSLAHSGALGPGQEYRGQVTLILPRDLAGDYFVLVETNANRSVDEGSHTSNNSAASATALSISLTPTPDLTVSDVRGPSALRPGDPASVSYTLSNIGAAASSGAWRDRIYLEGGAGMLREVASLFNTAVLAAGSSVARSASFTLPASLPDGEWRWLVKTDTDDSVYERGAENNNLARAGATLRIARVDLSVAILDPATLVSSGEALRVDWRVRNEGGVALGSWTDQVVLAPADGSAPALRLVEIVRQGPLASGASYDAIANIVVPLDFSGAYELIVVSDAGNAIGDGQRSNNRSLAPLQVTLSPYADLAVSDVSAPQTLIADPATLAVAWTVSNQGSGAGRFSSWTDRVLLSRDDIFGNADDLLIGEYRHDGALAAGESYSRSESIPLAARSSGRFQLFVVSDARHEVFENHAEANNIARLAQPVDVMPVAYADLQVTSVTTAGLAASGRPLTVNWEVVNNGIGSTDSAEWSDQVWLSRHADGSGVVAHFGNARHIGQLAVGAHYARSLEVMLPEGISGTHYLNVRTGGPFEFVFTDNNRGSSLALPVELSTSPDLRVESIVAPASAQEGALIDVSWTVINQGDADANGSWVDSVWLLPASGAGSAGNAAIALGSFSHQRRLAAGTHYPRTEQLRLPSRIEGLYRLKLITNDRLGASGEQIYEHGDARQNNTLLAAETTAIALNTRPDLRVATVIVPEQVSAGTATAIRYTISNFGAAQANGRWTDKVYLSLDGKLSGDDRLLAEMDNAGALGPGESYSSETAPLDIPIRFRGDAYLIVVADGSFKLDEYPNDANNAYAARFTVDPVPFSDLVTSQVVAPDQAVHGARIEVRYQVSNHGSAMTRGEAAALDSWSDTIWLARDKRRPGAHKGDILLGSFTHIGHLGVGESYLGTVRVTLPDALRSGEYFLSVWSDTYDVILEDTLATNINADDPTQIDNNNYQARAISVLGTTPPDLRVSEVVAPVTVAIGESYRFSYRVENRGDAFNGRWTDSVYLADSADWDAAREIWHLADYAQTRSLGFGESYSVSQTLQLAPWIKGSYLIVRTDSGRHLAEADESNNARASASQLNAEAADLRVSEVRAQADNAGDANNPRHFSGEETTLTWTVTNFGAPVWSGTRSWVDTLYLSRDPSFIAERAIPLGSVVHANVGGLASNTSYTGTARLRLPVGADGEYYVYVITDAESDVANPGMRRARSELSSGGSLAGSIAWYSGANAANAANSVPGSVFEGLHNDNNFGRGSLAISYREPDLQVDHVVVALAEDQGEAFSGQPLTISWTVSNRGNRETRSSSWVDGIYLSRDASLDYSDHALQSYAVQLNDNGQAKPLRPGESYTASLTTTLPASISGDFHILVNTDTAIFADRHSSEASSIRDGLPPLGRFGDSAGKIREFADEGNNLASTPLAISLATPPDLQLAEVLAPERVIAGQDFSVGYRVVNGGGDTPRDQGRWFDLVYLSRDRFLDLKQDRYLGYLEHSGGLAAGGSYEASLMVSAPPEMYGPWYVFVISDPAHAWGGGEFGRLREFGGEQNNALAAVQPLLIEIPPPADLIVTNLVMPASASASVGEPIRIDFTITNQSSNSASGRWTDAIYLSADNEWDLGDTLLGKREHNSGAAGLAGNASYTGTLSASLPPFKDGNWRVIVRPDLYNEVFEGYEGYAGSISEGIAGLRLPPGEANNRSASGGTLQVSVPEMQIGTPLQTTLSPGQARLYKVAVAAGETLRVSLDADAAGDEGSNELYLRYGDLPSSYAFDAAYDRPLSADQEVWLPSTQAGDYYLLLRARQGAANTPVTLRADLLPLSITRISPDQGGSGSTDNGGDPGQQVTAVGQRRHRRRPLQARRPGQTDPTGSP